MAFGQQSGPAASAKQVAELLDLLHAAGHVDFRDARGPLGFTQRQAAGRFTRDEATSFIEQLEAADASGSDVTRAPAPERLSSTERILRSLATHDLIAELDRRGWNTAERP